MNTRRSRHRCQIQRCEDKVKNENVMVSIFEESTTCIKKGARSNMEVNLIYVRGDQKSVIAAGKGSPLS